MTDALLTIFMFGGGGGVLGSLLGLLYSLVGKPGETLRVGNSTGLGFLLGASIGTVAGIFESMLHRLG